MNKNKDLYIFVLVSVSLVLLGIIVWAPRINDYRGFVYVECRHLVNSYLSETIFHLSSYFPWHVAHRPVGRDAISLMLAIFGEDHVATLSVQLAVHILSAVLCFIGIFLILSGG